MQSFINNCFLSFGWRIILSKVFCIKNWLSVFFNNSSDLKEMSTVVATTECMTEFSYKQLQGFLCSYDCLHGHRFSFGPDSCKLITDLRSLVIFEIFQLGAKESTEVKENVALSSTSDGPPKPMNDSAYEDEEEEEEEEDEDGEEAQAEGNAKLSQGITPVPCIYNKLAESLKGN